MGIKIRNQLASKLRINNVPGAGLEPARTKVHWILSPACLPIPPPGQNLGLKNKPKILSERRDSNPRPRPWQGRALPAELLSRTPILQ